ncbi:aminotransferase class V-fold PLP-dependent enzyme [Steroidobacter sp. S1-65]|uniref:Aminotransferase class V-fold PLP-dependent enzyme n=1 Tax=Steroidobacter gossypii TaxID=2805490 RepID=A0ABS1X140_9GAMM|nr:aminotransferase class V-fold PLP-dependent enzyme [Steroidobacter gossypii]MBM0106926.1 aminotransferase class V-fold PLP-dependent enzyme [Steroidobacter gossypii]
MTQTQAGAPEQRAAFEIPDHITYLNCASLCPRLKAVTAAGQASLVRMGTPWKVDNSDWFGGSEQLRSAFGRIINAPASSIALVPAVSYGIAVAALNVPVKDGDNIVVVDQEYPSNFYSWRRLARQRGAELRVVLPPPGGTITDAIISLIDRRTAVVATQNCHWTDGTFVDLRRVGAAARANDAALVVDASQSLGAYPFDVQEIQPDFLVTVGYKWLLGPYALGYMYVAERWHSQGVPLEESWLHREGSESFVGLVSYTEAYKAGAARFSQGEAAQLYLSAMALAALEQIQQWTPSRIQQQLGEWTTELAARAKPLGLTCVDASNRMGHLIGLRAKNGLPENLVTQLADRDIYVAARGSSIRVAPHLHSTASDMDRLVTALGEILR